MQADPSAIMSLSTAFWDAQALLTSNRLGVFDTLSEGALDATELADKIGTQSRPTLLLLQACVALGLLEESDGLFSNSPSASAFLVSGAPGYLGNAIRYSDNLYETWGNLEKALISDQPQLETSEYTGADAGLTKDFVYAMHDRAMGIGRMLVDLVDLSGRSQMLDVGGGPGTYSALFAQKNSQLRSTVLELPGVAEHAKEIVASLGVANRVGMLPGSFRDTPFPSGNDVVLISGVVHRELEDGCRFLIEKAMHSLVPGGLLIISDVFTDAGGCSPAFATMFGLNMLLTAPGGGVHADADMAMWMRESGFDVQPTIAFPVPMPHRVVIGSLTDGL